jgi:hypothetical protein
VFFGRGIILGLMSRYESQALSDYFNLSEALGTYTC